MSRQKRANTPFEEKVLTFYKQGHSGRETSERFGIPKQQLDVLVRRNKASNGRTINEINAEKAKKAAQASLVEREKKTAQRVEALGFEYLGGYRCQDSYVITKCKTCGDITKRCYESIRKGTAFCKVCQHNESVIRQTEKDRQRDEQKQLKAMQKLIEPLKLSSYQLSQQKKLDEKRICKVCGNSYTIRYWQALTGMKYVRASGYCSLKCQKDSKREREKGYKKITGHDSNSRRRCRRYNSFYSGHKITWKTLAKKRGLSFDEIYCEICGRKCDPNDHSWSRYTGPLYPSVDHIIALANGGGDVWDNVRLACMECNSRLGGKIRQNKRDYIEKRWDNGND